MPVVTILNELSRRRVKTTSFKLQFICCKPHVTEQESFELNHLTILVYIAAEKHHSLSTIG
jgi:hypothetical protein